MKFLIFFVLIISCNVLALPIVKAQDLHFRKYSLPLEFSNEKITTVLQSTDHFIWLGTSNGVFRFDGSEYQHINSDSAQKSEVKTLFEDSHGMIWVGYTNGTIGKIKNSRFQLFEPEEGFPKVAITGFAEDRFGNIWFSTYGEGAYVFQNNKMYNLNTDDGLSDDFVYAIATDMSGNIWLGTDGGIAICSFNKGKKDVHILDYSNGLPDNIVTTLVADSTKVWIGMESGGVCRYDISDQRFDLVTEDWKFGRVTKILPFEEGLWVGTARNGIIDISVHDNPLPDRINNSFFKIEDLLSDTEGNVWIVNGSSTIFFTNRTFAFISEINGQQIRNIQSILHTTEGDIWYSTDEGLFLISTGEDHKKKLINYTEKLGKGKFYIISMYEDASGLIWFGTFDKGVFRYNPHNDDIQQITEKEGLVNNNVLSISGSSQDIWFATLGGVSRGKINRDGHIKFTNYTSQNGLGSNYVYKVFADSRGRIWFATDGEGVTMLNNGLFTNYSMNEGLQSTTVYMVTEDASGDIWIGTANAGIYKYNGNGFDQVKPKNNLRDPGITTLTGDRIGNILIVSSQGIDVLDPISGTILYHGNEAGINDIEPNLNTYSVDGKGNIWLGTQNGIIRYTPVSTRKLPVTRINQMQVFMEPWEQNDNSLSYDQNHVTFNYQGFWYHNPHEVTYLIKLEGYDNGWVGSRNNFITYPKLAPGDYKFMVKSSANGYYDDAVAESYAFSIAPPFYRRTWFYFVAFAITTGIIIYAVKERDRRFRMAERQKKEQVQIQFETLKSQVNPHFLFNSFNTLAAVIEEDKNAAVEYVEKLSDFYRSILVYRERNVITLSEELEMIRTYHFLQMKRYKKNFLLRIDIPAHLMLKSIPPMTLQLLLENAVKHNIISREKPLLVEIFSDGDYIVIRNNLQKRNRQEPSTGMGLENIKNRYRLLTAVEVQIEERNKKYSIRLPILPEKA